ncbi:hypothetical protein AB1Y20_003059 [Prymnesium parvum]|uniref:Nucleotide-diphospho-sugar transferase domain-containing protein n=1 Tax=Prymnesium parvum TaxID=97485 RepID=A0AB34J9Q6_PRYPA
MTCRSDGYTLVGSDDAGAPPASARPVRPSTIVVVVLALLSFFYLTTSFSSTRNSSWSTRSVAGAQLSFGTYERMKYENENQALKQKLAELKAMLAASNAAASNAAAGSAAEGGRPTQTATYTSMADAAQTPSNVSREPIGQTAEALRQMLRGGATSAASLTARGRAAAANASAAGNPDRLTPELIRSRCDQHNIILVTFVNSKRADYGYTWAAHVRRLGLSNYLVGAMDGEALRKLKARAIPTFDMNSGLTTADYGWGTKNFRQLGLRKTELIITLLRAGADPILTDADALVTRDPSPFIARLRPEAQILVTSDHLMSTTRAEVDVLEVPERAVASAWNIGYFYLHHSVLPALLQWQEECKAHPNLWDQNLFKDVLKIGGLRFSDKERPAIKQKRLFLGYNGTIAIGILPINTFCSGHTFFVQRMPQRLGVQPYSVHTTFQYSGAVGKTHRLREGMLWEDGPEYFAPQRGLVTYTPRVDRRLLRPAGQMGIAAHFEVMNAQLRELRAAFLLAARLDRLLVLPPLVCGLDRFWAPHNGTIPGSDTTLPIEPCPIDHLLDLEHIERQTPLTSLLREWSYFANPCLPASERGPYAPLPPPAALGENDLAPLRRLASQRVLNLSYIPDLFATLPDAEKEAAMQQMRTWTSIWCCSIPPKKNGPGHVWYDMFWDVVPRMNRYGKLVHEPWVPTFGP